MASQSDTLNLAASVVDQFSKPLSDLTRQLKSFSSLEQTTSQRGKRTVDEHWKSYRSLAEQSKYTSENIKKLLTPAIEGLGLSTIIATRSLGSFATALKELGEHAQTLEFLKEQTGLGTQKLREFEEAGKRVGISYEQTDSALRKFAENLNQYKKGKGDFITNFIGQPADVLAFVRSLAGKTAEEAADAVRKKLASTKGEERALYARLFELPENMGQETDEVFARVRKNLGVLSEQSEKDLAEMNQSWFDLKEAIEGASNSIEAEFSPALAGAYKWTADFAKQHPYIAMIAGSFASMSSSIVQMTAGLVVLKSIFGARTAAAVAAPAATAAGAGGIGALGVLGLGLGAGLGAYGIRSLTHDEDVEGTGYGAHYTGGRSAIGVTIDNFKKWWAGADLMSAHADTDPRSGLGAGRRALMARGTSGESGFGSEVRDQAAVSKSVSTGAKEGVLAAFYQWFSDPAHGGLGGSAGGGGGGGSPGLGGGGGSPGGGGGGVSPGGAATAPPGSAATPGGLESLLTPRGGGSVATAAGKAKPLTTPSVPGGGATPIAYRGGGTTPAEPVAGVPYAAGEMEGALGIDPAHYDAFRNSLAGIESGKRGYNLLGGAGGHFAGRYQMGALGGHTELQDTARSLGEATPSVQEFLRDPKMQERFFERYTLNHHKYLMAHSPEYAALSPKEKLAALGYAHNQGAGGAAQYLRTHRAGHDAFGTGGDAYIRAIRRAEDKLDATKSAEPEKHSGLDANVRQHMASIVKHEGHAKVSIDLKGFPRGTKTATSSTGIFKEVRLNRGRAMSSEA